MAEPHATSAALATPAGAGRCPRSAPPAFGLSAGVALLLAMVPLGCTFCGSEPRPPRSGMASAARAAAAEAVGLDTLPAGITLPRGNCDAGMFLSSDQRCVPLTWHCPPAYYQGGPQDGCDCNCGVADPDCDQPQAQTYCYRLGKSEKVANCAVCAQFQP